VTTHVRRSASADGPLQRGHPLNPGLADINREADHCFTDRRLWRSCRPGSHVPTARNSENRHRSYYLVVHALHRPNLRRRSLAFLVEELPRAFRDPSVMRGHGLEVTYGDASLAFVVALTVYLIREGNRHPLYDEPAHPCVLVRGSIDENRERVVRDIGHDGADEPHVPALSCREHVTRRSKSVVVRSR
jgi:hypothetical protein